MSELLAARGIAADVVGRVLRLGAYSNVLMERAIVGLSSSDQARVKALVYGVLRRVESIDEIIRNAADRDITKLDATVLDRLRVAVFEITYGRTPAPLLVSAGVDLVRQVNPRAAGLANAVLRRAAGFPRPDAEGLYLPEWLTTRLELEWGQEKVDAFAVASASEPERVVRARHHREPGFAGITNALEIGPGPIPDGTVVQDAASIAVGNVVGAEPGMRVLDMAAAPGGKTLHLLDQVMGNDTGPPRGGIVIALDRHQRRVRDAAKRAPQARWVVADGVAAPFPPRSFDRVLLDAPCSGLGTLRRRPEIRLRLNQSDVQRLARLQRRLLESAFDLVAPDGRLVYSVCTVTPEETVEVTRDFDLRPPDLPGETWGNGRLLAPHLTGTDGMFVAIHQG
jgi:16S rRNA (cytosine967-C5)-methyltransferase